MNPIEAPLVVQGLVKRYKSATAVDGVSFEVPRGKVFCLVGPNGAGKTTTLEISQGRRKATAGTVRMFGEDPWNASREIKSRIGVLPQFFAGFDELTVRENVEYFADIFGADADVPALLDQMGLREDSGKRFSKLSGGTKRRVGIVSALVNDPELLFLDEPTAGVDPANRRRLWDAIFALRDQGRSVVLTTHYMDEAERLSDTIAIIYRGRIIASGTPEEVRLKHGGRVVLRLSGLERVPEDVAARPGFAVEPTGVASIPLGSAAEASAILEDLVRGGHKFREVSIREPTLDDAFVRLVAGGAAP